MAAADPREPVVPKRADGGVPDVRRGGRRRPARRHDRHQPARGGGHGLAHALHALLAASHDREPARPAAPRQRPEGGRDAARVRHLTRSSAPVCARSESSLTCGTLKVQERTRLTYEDRRTAILDAARHEFARKGFRGAGTADIAARCGCSEPMLYKHFASKQELFAAVLTHTGAMMGQRVDALLDESGDSVTTALIEVAE